MQLTIYADGASSGNPGPAAIGVVIKDEKGRKLAEISQYLGIATNNQAEYRAIIAALEAAQRLKATDVVLCLDSELAVKQLLGEYRAKSLSIKTLYFKVRKLIKDFKNFTIIHVSHQQNREAHNLAKAPLKQFRRK